MPNDLRNRRSLKAVVIGDRAFYWAPGGPAVCIAVLHNHFLRNADRLIDQFKV